jgi:SAM-dependent methyltransferase
MIRRLNLVDRQAESWRPVAFRPSPAGWQRLVLTARRFFDLQTASIWADLSLELPAVRGTVVDVGCGAQPFRSLFSPQVTYVGIDTIDAKAHFDYEVPDTRYYDGTAWPVEDGSTDFVLCTETLEHVPDARAFLAEAARCLAPGGRILITVPFAARWHYIPHDYWRFTPSSLKTLLTEAGFEEVRIYARGNEVTVACYKLMALMLPLLAPQRKNRAFRLSLQSIGLALSPVFVLLAGIAHLSLRGEGGDDCLGYTAIAAKRGRVGS